VSTFLRDHRHRRALSTTELAVRVGVHPNSVLRWERRERLPGPEHIHALASSLSVDTAAVTAFFDDERAALPHRESGLRGHGLRPLRRAVGITVATIAREVGAPVSTVYNWEAGRVRIPSEHLGVLAGLLRLDRTTLHQLLSTHPVHSGPGRATSQLRRLRLRRGLSQGQVARLIGMSRHSVGAWERGARPPLAAIRRLAGVYAVSVSTVARAADVSPPELLDPDRWAPGTLPRVLTVLRDWSGLTQAEVAERCGCSRASVRNWERGRTEPSPALRAALERMYRLTDGSLLGATARR
jgi:transcriptional regulator with XRE-family HTH domain